MNRDVLNNYKNDKDRLLISKIMDKIKFCETRNKIQSTSFLDLSEQRIIERFLKSQRINNYLFVGGYEEAERKVVLFYPEKMINLIDKLNLNEYIKVIRITIPNEMQGEYSHRNYLGGLMKLGIEREKVGDILVDEKGADILVQPELVKFLLEELKNLTRFSKSKVEQIDLKDLKTIEKKTEIFKITVASMRIDNVVSELARCSRGKANEILAQDRVLVNYETIQKQSKEIKEDDTITIRGKGRFIIKNIVGNTRKGRLFVEVEKFV